MTLSNDTVTLSRASVPAVPATKQAASPALYRFFGTTLSALICAVFWTAILAFLAPVFGIALTAKALTLIGLTIGAFVWAVMTAILAQTA
jgi:hypothetical protein